MKLAENETSRRRFLKVGGAALAGGLLGTLPARGRATRPSKRIGVLVPNQSGRTSIEEKGTYVIPGEDAYRGATLAQETVAQGAAEVLLASAPDPEAALRAAQRFTALNDVFALVGGFDPETCRMVSRLAEERQVPFFNVGAPSDALRGEQCSRYAFHVQASAAMYLDALIGWHTASQGRRRWYFVREEGGKQEAHHRRAQQAAQAHAEAQVAGNAVVGENQADYLRVLKDIRAAEPDVVLLLMDASLQLDFMAQYDSVELGMPVTGLPDPVAQTRNFFAAAQNVAPQSGSGHRAVLWEPRLRTEGAQALNDRFEERFDRPMGPSAWAAYQSVAMLTEAAAAVPSLEGPALVSHLEAPGTRFEVGKEVPVSFRAWDHQLRQPLYMVELQEAQTAEGLARLTSTLPAAEPSGLGAALDDLGDAEQGSACTL